MQGVNRQEFQLGVLEREVQSNRQLYELFLSRTKETSVSNNLQAAVARIVDPAQPATAPLRPNKAQIVLFAMLAALGLGGGAAVTRDRLTGTLHDAADAEQRLQCPVLGALPSPPRSTDLESTDSAFVDDPGSNHADAIRSARTSIVLADLPAAQRLILVTSSFEGEGKTNLCMNLAFALAQAKRTLLIDCDLRDPQIGMRLGLPTLAKGICDLALGNAELKECVHSVPGSSLLVMPVGTQPDDAEEFLLSPRLREALRSLASRADIVLLDTPGLADCTDALILSQQTHRTIFVVKAGVTTQAVARQGLQQLRRAGASILGLVVTNVPLIAARVPRRGPPGRAPRAARSSVLDV